MKKNLLKLTNIVENQLSKIEKRNITGGKVTPTRACVDTDGCGSSSSSPSKYGADMEAGARDNYGH